MKNWFKTSEHRPPPREGCSDDMYGVSVDVLVWRSGMSSPCISCLAYNGDGWLDSDAGTPLPRHCWFTHWTYLPEIPKT